MKVNWINFLHFYQPPLQDHEIIDRVVNESYKWIIDRLKENKNWKITLNITGCLTDLLVKYGYIDLINDIKGLVNKGQIELSSTAAYHPILPLLPKKEIIYQIKMNYAINKKYFKEAFEPKGFFCPEMAFDNKVLKIISDFGYKWVILDELCNLKKIDFSKKYKIKNLDLYVIFRNRNISKTFVPKTLKDNILKQISQDQHNLDKYIITGTDGELYGHHHVDIDGSLHYALKDSRLNCCTCWEFFNKTKKIGYAKLRPGSWETSKKDFKNNDFYPLWYDLSNEIQLRLWKFTYFVLKNFYNNKNDPNFYWARKHLDSGISSCSYWWCSKRRPSPFSPLTWNPDYVSAGLTELVKVIRSLGKIDKNKKIKAENKYFELQRLLWQNHWQRKID
jgi:hypothetical protein